MRLLDKLTDDARQETTLTGIPGLRITLTMRYLPTQQRWMMDVVWGDFELRGAMMTASPNMLRNFKNILPFGLACVSNDGLDPYFINDFASGRCKLYLLNADELESIETAVFSE